MLCICNLGSKHVCKVESDHLVVAVKSTLSSPAIVIKNSADWYPVEPAKAIDSKEPLSVINSDGVANYVLLRRITYYPDDLDNKVSSAPIRCSFQGTHEIPGPSY